MLEKQTAIALGAAATLALGMASGIIYENSVPWGLRAQKDRLERSLPSREATAYDRGARDQFRKDEQGLATWQSRATQCDAQRRQTSEDVASTLDAARTQMSASRDAAYQLGRQAGLARCPRETTSETSNPDSQPASSVGVRPDDVELASVLAGAAYRPSPR